MMEIAVISPPSRIDYATRIERQLNTLLVNTPTITHHRPQSGELPAVTDPDGVIIAGSSEHVYERQLWIGTMADRVQKMLQKDIPVLGVCFGHQFLADILGGTINPLNSREAGFTEVHLTNPATESPIFRGFNDSLIVFEWHKDIVTNLPERCLTLARNETGVQAFSSTRLPAYGVQFHPECGKEAVRKLISSMDNGCMRETILATCTEQALQRATRAHQIYTNFVNDVCLENPT